MANPYINKVVLGNETLLDLTADTVTPQTLYLGTTAHDASGAAIVGTATDGSMVIRDTQDSHGGTIREITAGSVVQGTKSITQNGTGIDVAEYAEVDVAVPAPTPSLQSKTATPTTSQQTVTPDSGYDGLSSVTVSAMPTGTAGTPTATKGTVSNHAVSVTPSVTNTTGYITGGTKTGTAVSVSASELVSGSQTITENGTVDVTNLASVNVDVASSGGPTYTVTLTNSGHSARGYVQLNGEGTTYYTSGQTITFHSGDTLRVHVGSGSGYLYVDGELVAQNTSTGLTYDYQRPDGNLSVSFQSNATGYCYITLSTLNVAADGVYDVSQYLKANVMVAGHTATITHTVGSTYTYPYIQVNGTGDKYRADGDVFKFNDGDTLKIMLQGTIGGGKLFLNGTSVYDSGQSATSYTWTPPSCDLSIDIQTGSAGYVYVTTSVMNISANGSYEVPGYGYVNVSV